MRSLFFRHSCAGFDMEIMHFDTFGFPKVSFLYARGIASRGRVVLELSQRSNK